MGDKRYSFEFNNYNELIEIGKEIDVAMNKQKNGFIQLLDDENVSYDLDSELGMPIIVLNDIKNKSFILKYAHPA